MQPECKLRKKIYIYIRAEHQRSSGSGSHVHALAGIQAKEQQTLYCTELKFFLEKKKKTCHGRFKKMKKIVHILLKDLSKIDAVLLLLRVCIPESSGFLRNSRWIY